MESLEQLKITNPIFIYLWNYRGSQYISITEEHELSLELFFKTEIVENAIANCVKYVCRSSEIDCITIIYSNICSKMR